MFTYLEKSEVITKKVLRTYQECSFEHYTGGDIILSPLSTSPTLDNIYQHLDAGALVIQVKHSTDLISSIIDQRLFRALERMLQYNIDCYQAMLLVTGTFSATDDGRVNVDGRAVNMKYRSYRGALAAWVLRGGVTVSISHPCYMEDELNILSNQAFGSKLRSAHHMTTKRPTRYTPDIRVSSIGSLDRLLTEIESSSENEDLRTMIYSLPGIGQSILDQMWGMMKQKTLTEFISLIEDETFVKKIKGYGSNANARIRKIINNEAE